MTHTYQIVAELEVQGEYDRDVQVIITCDREVSVPAAMRIINVLYPNRQANVTDVNEV
jgi:hypothetical protein